jgi:hypothetical protein
MRPDPLIERVDDVLLQSRTMVTRLSAILHEVERSCAVLERHRLGMSIRHPAWAARAARLDETGRLYAAARATVARTRTRLEATIESVARSNRLIAESRAKLARSRR